MLVFMHLHEIRFARSFRCGLGAMRRYRQHRTVHNQDMNANIHAVQVVTLVKPVVVLALIS